MNDNFEDIRMVRLDVSATKQSADGSDLHVMYILLSSEPTADWAKIFISERANSRGPSWKRPNVEGSYIIVTCIPEELEAFYIKDLKSSVASTNSQYRALLAQRHRELQKLKQSAQKRTERILGIAQRLNFD